MSQKIAWKICAVESVILIDQWRRDDTLSQTPLETITPAWLCKHEY